MLAHHDLALEQYASDIYRASYIAELLFEYKDEKGREIAPEVIEGLMEGLFKRSEFRGAKYHPVDDMVSFVKRVRKVKSGDTEVEMSSGEEKPKKS